MCPKSVVSTLLVFSVFIVCSPGGVQAETLSSFSGSSFGTTFGDVSSDGDPVEVGDLDRDGLDDVIVGAPTTFPGGAVFIFFGSGSTFTLLPSGAGTVGGEFGAALDVGDLDQDGLTDLVVGAPGEFANAGSHYAFHAADFTGFSWPPAFPKLSGLAGDRLGSSVAVIPNVDFPGSGPDIAAAGPTGFTIDNGQASPALRGYIDVHAGTDGTLITFFGPFGFPNIGETPTDLFGLSLEGGDFNGDGRGDLAIGMRGLQTGGTIIRVYTGNGFVPQLTPDQRNIFDVEAPPVAEFDGENFVGFLAPGERSATADNAGDIDGDGIDDLIVGLYKEKDPNPFGNPSMRFGKVVVRNIDKGQDLAVITGDFFGSGPGTVGEELGTSVAGIGDLNGDGFDDFAYANGFGEITVLAGSNQLLLADRLNPPIERTLEVLNVTPNVPIEALATGDTNGDNFVDLVELDRSSDSTGTVRVTSFATSTASFSGINNIISVSAGGRQTLFLKAPGVDADDVAALLAANTSVSDPALGIPISNGFIPLLAGDPLLLVSVENPNLIFRVNPVALAANAEGTATGVSRVEFGPGELPQSLIGTTVFFSYVVVETTPTSTPLKDAGGVVSLTFAP